MSNLRQIGVALHYYNELHGMFPGGPVDGEGGSASPTWRVLLLPLIEREDLYNQYRSSEAWDSPQNARLLDQIPFVFVCPDDHHRRTSETSYVAIVGKGTAWDRCQETGIQRVPAELGLVLEMKGSGIAWTENRDLSIDELKRICSNGLGISSPHPGGFNVLCADGSVLGVRNTIPGDALLALFCGSPMKPEWQKYLVDSF